MRLFLYRIDTTVNLSNMSFVDLVECIATGVIAAVAAIIILYAIQFYWKLFHGRDPFEKMDKQ